MHILKIIHGYPPNYNAGSEVYSQSIVDELKKSNKVTVFTREENEYELDFRFRKETKDDVDFVYVNMPRGKDGYNHHLINEKFNKLLNEIKPDIVHIGHLNHLSIGIIDELKKLNIPILYTLHDFWLMCPRGQFLQRNFDGENLFQLCDKQENSKCAKNCYSMYFSGYEMSFEQSLNYEISHTEHIGKDKLDDLEHWTNWVDARMFAVKEIVEKIDLFHAPSKYLMNRYINDFGIPKEKIFYLDYGFPTHYLQPVETCESEEFTFGYIGTHIPAKGINLLIDAFKAVEGKARLKIFGREQGQNTLALKEIAKTSKNPIEFCGEYVNQNLAKVVFSNVHCIVVPSIWAENSPLVIHEAQSCKIPVITADYGGMKEYVADNVNGLLFQHRDKKSLSEQLQFAVDNQDKMKELGQRGYLYSDNGEIPNIKEHCKELIKKYKEIENNG